MQLPSTVLILVLGLAQSTWMMLTVLVVRLSSLTAITVQMFIVGMVTMRMLE